MVAESFRVALDLSGLSRCDSRLARSAGVTVHPLGGRIFHCLHGMDVVDLAKADHAVSRSPDLVCHCDGLVYLPSAEGARVFRAAWSRRQTHEPVIESPSQTKAEENGCRKRLVRHVPCHRRLPAPPGAALRVALCKPCRLTRVSACRRLIPNFRPTSIRHSP